MQSGAYGTAGRAYHSGAARGGEERQDRRRLVQLLVCLVLFLTVLIGKGAFPQRAQERGRQLLALLGADVDFRGAFARLGESLSEQDNVLGELGSFCVEVFGAGQTPQRQADAGQMLLLREEAGFLSRAHGQAQMWEHCFQYRPLPAGDTEQAQTEAEEPPEEAAPEELSPQAAQAAPEAVPAVGTVLLEAEGPESPAGFTLDQLSLGALETVTPVFGPIRSGFGYRIHPISGQDNFHSGVDIGADSGCAIAAFADGVVEYVGENSSYGRYLQIDHGEGIKSFYAHCSKIEAQQGQRVTAGETVALVGSTGNATGPHLHFELKCAGLRINPAYYIDCKQS